MKKGGKKNSKTINIASVVLGGVSIILSFIVPYVVAITGVLGLIFAYSKKGEEFKKLNRWGFILNLIGIFLAIFFLMMVIIYQALLNNGSFPV